MINLIYQCSKYIIVILMILYTLLSFTAFLKKNRDKQNAIFRKQRTYTLMIHFILNLLLLLNEKEVIVLELYVCQIALYITMVYVYQFVYRKLSRLVLNHMMFLLMIGLTELVRLDWKLAARQMMFAAAGLIICLFVPLCIERIHFVGQLGWIYGTAGISILLYVLKFGVTKYGAKNWIMVAGFSLQPSEFVKILFVFFHKLKYSCIKLINYQANRRLIISLNKGTEDGNNFNYAFRFHSDWYFRLSISFRHQLNLPTIFS